MSTILRKLVLGTFAVVAAFAARHTSAATIGLNFTGANRSASGVFVPDTMGAVGPNHIVEMLNGVYTVYEKTTGRQLQRMSLTSFWNAAGQRGGVALGGDTDPTVVYDPTADRWFAVALQDTGTSASRVDVAVSISSDPTFPSSDLTRGLRGLALDGDPSAQPNRRWSDLPTLGVDRDAITISTTLLDITNQGIVEPRGIAVYSIPKSDLLQSTPTVANRSQFTFDMPAAWGSTIGVIEGVLNFEPADGRAALFAANPNFGLQRWDFANVAESRAGAATLSQPISIPISPIGIPPRGNQPGNVPDFFNWIGPYTGIDGLPVSHRVNFGSNLVQQGNHAWGVHIARAGEHSGVRWYEIDLDSNQVVQSGTISDPALDLIYPSIAVNQFGDAVIGFTATGETLFPSAYAVVGDTVNGVTTFGGLMELKRGVSTYVDVDSQGRNRWGDYSATVVDPSDPLHFWTFQEFASGTNQWAVQITEIVVPEPSTLVLIACSLFVGGLTALLRNRSCS